MRQRCCSLLVPAMRLLTIATSGRCGRADGHAMICEYRSTVRWLSWRFASHAMQASAQGTRC